MRRLVMVLCALSITGLFAPRFPAFGEIMTTLRFEEVPPKRLVDNLQAYIKAHPKDADAYYELGRVYSLLYTVPKKTLSAAFQKLDGKPLEHGRLNAHYDDFGTPLSPDNSRETPPLKAEQEKYLRLSLENYKKALEFGSPVKKEKRVRMERYSYYLLGYGWMLEQGIAFAKSVPAPFKQNGALASEEEWRDEALKMVRRVYREYMPTKEEIEHTLLNFMIPAKEAATTIIRLERNRTDSQSKKEVAALKEWLKSGMAVSRAISPIIFPLNGHDPLSKLVSPHKAVRFDLMGSRMGERWSWVNANTGILVWDPLHTGHIRSGYQLFGNVTWCMIWQHGYAPLARLDANGDGYLTGKELEGIAVWCDKNGNGVSDKGEVLPLSSYGISRIAVRGTRGKDGIYWNPKGLIQRNGNTVPTYDWIAKEIAK